MKVILLQDDKNLGKKGDVVEASDGYARNFILPKKIGMEATPKNLNDLKMQKQKQAKLEKEQLEAAQGMAALLAEKQVTLSMKAGEGGKVFGSVSSKEIAAAYKEQHQIEIDKKKIQLPENIKSFGTHEVPIKLHPQVTGKIFVKVVEAE
jgi:large subunit ribosomal protein L9